MPKRISRVQHEYAGRQITVGETFDVEQQDVDLLLAIGRIEREDGDKVPGHVSRDMAANWPNGYETRALQPERQKRPYNRKSI